MNGLSKSLNKYINDLSSTQGMVELVHRAVEELYPEKLPQYQWDLAYSGRFNSYNANVKYNRTKVAFYLSKDWRKISDEIKIGLVQNLLLKIFGKENARAMSTINLDLYTTFLKNIHLAIPKSDQNPALKSSFDRVNNLYCNGLIDAPNLVWGKVSTRKLGSYEYGSDRIIISSVLQQAPQELLDYVMYHELLHKKHKFNCSSGASRRSYHHTALFKQDESRFDRYAEMEMQLQDFLRQFLIKTKAKKFFGFSFH